MLTLLKQIGVSFLDLMYPPLCLHCDTRLEPKCHIFCRSCLLLLEQIDPTLRCPLCFSSDFDPEMQKHCLQCQTTPRSIKRIASVFDYEGPPATLVKQLKYGGQSYLAQGGGAYLAARFLSCDWPMPDFIIPMPMSKLRRLDRGYNQSELLAESFAKLLGSPVSKVLKRRSGDFSQAGLDHQQRINLKSDSFIVVDGNRLHEKKILLIDDVMTTGSSLNCCAEALSPYFPESIYALTLCRTL